ncbi:MAG: MaoC family dehydratase [Rhabdochlamydiaceae bacterium]
MSNTGSWSGRYYEDLNPGDVFKHRPGRTVTETDNTWFTLLTCNTNPIHFDSEYAKKTKFGRMLVNSALTLAIVTGLTVSDISMNGFNLEWDKVVLSNPIFGGDTLYAETEVLGKRESKSKPEFGIVNVRTRGLNQRGEEVIRFERAILVYKRASSPNARV